MSIYEQAAKRVHDSEALSLYEDIILDDWPEGEEHWQWVASATEQDILDWVDCIVFTEADDLLY